MQSFIYFTIAFVAFTAAKQLTVGPQVFSESQSSFSSSQNPDKRYVNQEYTFYLTPNEIKALQRIKSSENVENIQSTKERQSEQQNVNEEQLKWYNSQFLPKAPQLEIRGIATRDAFFQNQKSESEIQTHGAFLQNQKSESVIRPGNYNYINNLYSEEKPKEQTKEMQSVPEISKKNLENYYNWQKEQEDKTQQENILQNGAKWKQYFTVSTKNQGETRSNEQLKQQWNRILDHNRDQLKSLSPVPDTQESIQSEKSAEQWNSKYEIEKEIENILRDHRAYVFAKQSGSSQAEALHQRLPILIHKEVKITKHLPVTVVKNVKVPVPTPVLVPVPEPYEVKIPHPYPVPLQYVNNIPVPVIRNLRTHVEERH